MHLIIGAILGFLSIALGAYAEHGLRDKITAEHFDFLLTALRYNQIHAVVIVVIGLLLLNGNILAGSWVLKCSGWLFIIGTIIFSCSIYLAVIFNIPALTKVTPLGGMTLMLAWLSLIWVAIAVLNHNK